MAELPPILHRATGPSPRLLITGVLLVALAAALAFLSRYFPADDAVLFRPATAAVGVLMGAGLVYLVALHSLRKHPGGRAALVWIIVVGGILRAAMLPTNSILDDDFYRYLWDGGVLAHGMNPYSYAPSDALRSPDHVSAGPSALRELAAASGEVVSDVNHPHLRTIYPPVAQLAFAAAHYLRPWSLVAWRLVLFAVDIATLGLLILLLRRLNGSLSWVAAYWWNPLVVKEIFNSAHMDALAFPFVLAAVLWALEEKPLPAAASLALATAVKIWPVVLLPILLRSAVAAPRRLATAALLFGVLVAGMGWPVYAAGLRGDSGFVAYGRYWEMNDALYMLVLWGGEWVRSAAGLTFGSDQLVTRALVLGALVGIVVLLVRNRPSTPAALCENCALAVAALFLLSPTQFPWYYTWQLPLLVLRPRWSLLLLTALLPLYYLRFVFKARGQVEVFDYGIVWLQYIPVWILILAEEVARRRRRRAAGVVAAI